MFSRSSINSLGSFAPVSALLLACAAAAGAAQIIRLEPNGLIVPTANGTVHVEVCSPTVIHILVSATSLPIKPLVPTVIHPCTGAKFTTSSDSSGVQLRTGKLRVDIANSTGALRFLTLDGETVLGEQQNDGRSFPAAGAEDGVEQTFRLSPAEALYGLGQHQEGFLNLRDIPVRLLAVPRTLLEPTTDPGYGRGISQTEDTR